MTLYLDPGGCVFVLYCVKVVQVFFQRFSFPISIYDVLYLFVSEVGFVRLVDTTPSE